MPYIFELIVLSQCDGFVGLWDESKWGKRYSVQSMPDYDSRLVERSYSYNRSTTYKVLALMSCSSPAASDRGILGSIPYWKGMGCPRTKSNVRLSERTHYSLRSVPTAPSAPSVLFFIVMIPPLGPPSSLVPSALSVSATSCSSRFPYPTAHFRFP